MSQQQRVCSILPLNISAIHDICLLICHLLMCFGSLYCKQRGPRSNCSPRSFRFDRISLELIGTYATGEMRRGHFLNKNVGGKMVNDGILNVK